MTMVAGQVESRHEAEARQLSPTALRRIQAASALLVSPISFWELAMLVEKGRVALDRPTQEWVIDFRESNKVHVAELSSAIAVSAGELADFHGDPADRLIVATARSLRLPVVTKDDKIRVYAKSTRLVTAIW